MNACPSGKLAYTTPGEAARVALVLTKRSSTHSHAARASWNHGQLKHYRCPMCRQWHVGHTNPEGKRA